MLMMATSSTKMNAVAPPATLATRRHSGLCVNIHAMVRLKMAVEMANLAGLSHAGAPRIVRGSAHMATTAAANTASITRPTAVSGALARHRPRSSSDSRLMNAMIRLLVVDPPPVCASDIAASRLPATTMLPLSTLDYPSMLTMSTLGFKMGYGRWNPQAGA